jgi:hypothetical protein
VQKRSMNSKGRGMMVALVILATRGPLRRSEGRTHTVLSPMEIGSQIRRTCVKRKILNPLRSTNERFLQKEKRPFVATPWRILRNRGRGLFRNLRNDVRKLVPARSALTARNYRVAPTKVVANISHRICAFLPPFSCLALLLNK